MTDEKKKQSDEAQEFGDELENFEFDDADFEAGTPEPSEMKDKLPPSLPAMNAKSKIPILFGVVIGLFLLYKGVSYFITPNKITETTNNLDDAPILSMPTPKNTDDPDLLKQPPAVNAEIDEASAFLSEVNTLSNKEPVIQTVSIPDPISSAPTNSTEAPNLAVIPPKTPTPAAASPSSESITTTAIPEAMPLPVTPGPLTTAPITVAIPTEVTAQIQQKLDTQTEENEKRLEAMDRAIYRLSKKMEQVQDSVGQLGNDMGHINQSLTTMTTEVKKISQPTMSPPTTATGQISEPPKMETLANPSMAIHAIIPGRAWLRDKNGRTITVTEGDMLDQYGKVLVIDAPNGVVVTSSGTTLR